MATRIEMSNADICTFAAAIGIAVINGLHAHLPDHARLSREMINLEQAIGAAARLAGADPLSSELIDVGVKAWGAAMMQADKCINAGQPKVTRDAKGRFRRIEI